MPLPETERVDSHETRANHVRLMRKEARMQRMMQYRRALWDRKSDETWTTARLSGGELHTSTWVLGVSFYLCREPYKDIIVRNSLNVGFCGAWGFWSRLGFQENV